MYIYIYIGNTTACVTKPASSASCSRYIFIQYTQTIKKLRSYAYVFHIFKLRLRGPTFAVPTLGLPYFSLKLI